MSDISLGFDFEAFSVFCDSIFLSFSVTSLALPWEFLKVFFVELVASLASSCAMLCCSSSVRNTLAFPSDLTASSSFSAHQLHVARETPFTGSHENDSKTSQIWRDKRISYMKEEKVTSVMRRENFFIYE